MSRLDKIATYGIVQLKTVLNTTDIFRTLSTFRHIEFLPYKSIGKQFVKINWHNISSDKYFYFHKILNEAPKNF